MITFFCHKINKKNHNVNVVVFSGGSRIRTCDIQSKQDCSCLNCCSTAELSPHKIDKLLSSYFFAIDVNPTAFYLVDREGFEPPTFNLTKISLDQINALTAELPVHQSSCFQDDFCD